MPITSPASPDRSGPILAALPDLPRWVETRGMLLSGRCEILAGGDTAADVLVRSLDQPLIAAAGRPRLEPLLGATEDPTVRVVLCDPDLATSVGNLLPRWRRVAAVIHRLAGETVGSAGPRGFEIGILPISDSPRLADLPDSLRLEIESALAGGHVTAAFVEQHPVCFCYPAYETETLWDVSIDTLEPYRRRGLAAACVEFLIDHMRRHGKEPVWGALVDNTASLALARHLGFVPVDEMVVFLRNEARA